MVGRASEGLLLAMRASHASADDDVEALDRLAVRLHDDHRAHVVDVQVDRVVARHRHGHLELFRQVGAAVDRLDRVAGDDAVAVVVVAHLVEVKVRDVLLPVLDARSLRGEKARGGREDR